MYLKSLFTQARMMFLQFGSLDPQTAPNSRQRKGKSITLILAGRAASCLWGWGRTGRDQVDGLNISDLWRTADTPAESACTTRRVALAVPWGWMWAQKCRCETREKGRLEQEASEHRDFISVPEINYFIPLFQSPEATGFRRELAAASFISPLC